MVVLTPAVRACLSQEWFFLLQISKQACLRNGRLYSSSQSMLVSEMVVLTPALRACRSPDWLSLFQLSGHVCLSIWSSLLQISDHACLRNGNLYSSSQSMPVLKKIVFNLALRECLSQECSYLFQLSEHVCLRIWSYLLQLSEQACLRNGYL